MAWIDVSVPIRDGMVVFEGDPEVRISRAATLAEGASANVSQAGLGLHTGTHIDAPVHYIEGAPGVEGIALDALVGPCAVIDASGFDTHISADSLAALAIPDGATRLLLKTRNSRLWDLDRFSTDYLGLREDAARWLVERGTALIGIDYLSVAPHDDPAPTHVALLQGGVVILEGLDLRDVDPGVYDLVCLPLLIPGADGAPGRALLRPR